MAMVLRRSQALLAIIKILVDDDIFDTPLVKIPRGRHTGEGRNVLMYTQGWAEARIKIARMTLTIKLDGNWSSFQLANNTPPLSVTGSVIAPSARMLRDFVFAARPNDANTKFDSVPTFTTS